MLVAVTINIVRKIHKRPSGDMSPFKYEYANLMRMLAAAE